MAGEFGLVVEVVKQEGDRILVSVPLVGVGQGFQLRPGEQVVLVEEESGPAARPLIRSFTVDNVERESSDTLKAGNERFSAQGGTIQDEASPQAEQSGAYDVFVVEGGSSEGAEQVIAVRPTPPRTQ